MTTNLMKGNASGDEDTLMDDIAIGMEENEHEDCQNSNDSKESLVDHDKFGAPFPAPDDYPWALGW